jgi:hypothetical protein
VPLVDILNKYMEQLRDSALPSDEFNSEINFTEAAIIIQVTISLLSSPSRTCLPAPLFVI